MSNYTDAPACKLLATTCCVCSRPLLDALSVELGIGPDCRKKYMGKLEGPAREQANKIVYQLALIVSGHKPEDIEGLDQDAVQAAYALGGTKAVGAILAATSAHGSSLLEELRTLGFDKLADKFEAAWMPVRVAEVGEELRVEAPYNEAAVAAQREIKGRRWDKLTKANYFPRSQKVAVWHMLTRFYAGYAGIGPKGAFVVPANPVTAPKLQNTTLSVEEINRQEDEREARKGAMYCPDEAAMMAMEAEADRAQTRREEYAKAVAKGYITYNTKRKQAVKAYPATRRILT